MNPELDGSYLKQWTKLGWAIVIVAFGGFLVWASSISLSSASVSGGQLTLAKPDQHVAHLQGGWLKQVHVSEGQPVVKGQLLAEIEDFQLTGELERLNHRYWQLSAQQQRARHELGGAGPLSFATGMPAAIKDAQIALYQSHLQAFELQRKQLQHQQLMESQKLQAATLKQGRLEQRVALAKQELAIAEELAEKEYMAKMQLLTMQGRLAELQGELEINQTAIAQSQIALSDAKNQMLRLSQQRKVDALAELSKVGEQLAQVEVQLKIKRQVKLQGQMFAEQDGVVSALQLQAVAQHLLGAGEVLMQVVAKDSGWQVEGVIAPDDRDNVAPGQRVRVHLTGFNLRRHPALLGEVSWVDSQRVSTDSGEGYRFGVRLEQTSLSDEMVEKLAPGMLAQIFIEQQPSTLLEQLWRPLGASMRYALIEH